MLVSLSTLLSRTKRKKEMVVGCTVESLDMLEAVLTEAGKHGKPLMILVNSRISSVCSLSVFCRVAQELCQAHSYPVSLVLEGEWTEQSVSDFLLAGKWSLKPSISHEHSLAESTRITGLVAQQATERGLELVGEVSQTSSLNSIATFVHASGVHALVVRVTWEEGARGYLSTKHIENIVRHTKVPVFIEGEQLDPAWMGRLLKVGVSGWLLRDALAEAYTAGLRTGLRNRSASHLFLYQTYAAKAVSSTLSHYLQLT